MCDEIKFNQSKNMKFTDYFKSDSQEFLSPQIKDSQLKAGDFPLELQAQPKQVIRFLIENAGLSFNRSLYRLFTPADITKWNKNVCKLFPDFEHEIICFGFDWLGRIFALDKSRIENKQMQVVLLDPSSAEAFEIPCGFSDFHDIELVNYAEQALAEEFFNEYLQQNNPQPGYNQCISYIMPIFLGGDDCLHNLVCSDMEIYWEVCSEMLASAVRQAQRDSDFEDENFDEID